jgi:hypothetical protein
MTITVDQEPCQPVLLETATLGDAMAWLQEKLATTGKVVIKVEMDGKSLEGPDLTNARGTPIAERLVAFSTTDSRVLARVMIAKLAALIEFLAGQHGEVAKLFEQNETANALQRLSGVIASWGQVHEAFSGMVTMLKIDLKEMKVGEFPASDLLADFAGQLKSMQEALQNQDMVLLADILQYEMDGAIATWVGLLEATLARLEPLG